MAYFGVYDTRIRSARHRISRFFNGWFFSGVLSLVFAYLFHDFIIGGEIPRLIYFYAWSIILLAGGLTHFLVDRLYEHRRKKSHDRALVLGPTGMTVEDGRHGHKTFSDPKLLTRYLRDHTSDVYRLSL